MLIVQTIGRLRALTKPGTYGDGAPEALASAAFPPAGFNFGNVHVGDIDSTDIIVANTLLQGGDTLVSAANVVAAPLSATGSLSIAPGGTGTLGVSFLATTPGQFSFGLPLSLLRQNAAGATTILPAATVAVAGTVYQLALPQTANVGDLGPMRLGGSLTSIFRIGNNTLNIGGAGLDQESLVYAIGAPPSGLVLSGSASGTLATGNAIGIGVTLAPTIEGVASLDVPLTFVSTGAGTSGLPDTVLPGTVDVGGVTYIRPFDTDLKAAATVYVAAIPSYATSVDFGWTHPGQTVFQPFGVGNAALLSHSSSYVDTLSASWASIGAGFFDAGSSGSAFPLGFTATTAGVTTAQATLNFVSHDAVLPDILSPSTPITLTGTVSNYATLGVQEIAGGGSLSSVFVLGQPLQYTLNLGDVGDNQELVLAIGNAASGFADTLSGSADLDGGDLPMALNGGSLDFAGLTAGQLGTAFTIDISANAAGVFTDTIMLHGTGSNAGGYSGALADVPLVITGTVTTGTYTFAPVQTEDQLNQDLDAILNGDAGGFGQHIAGIHYVIPFDPAAGTITLDQSLTPIYLLSGSSVTIEGNGDTIDGAGTYDGFMLANGGSANIRDLTITHTGTVSFNGLGGSALNLIGTVGGAPAGAITLDNVNLFNNNGGASVADDAEVLPGDTLIVNSGSFGDSADPEGAIFVGGELDFAPAGGTNIQVDGPVTGNGPINVDGAGTVTLANIPPYIPTLSTLYPTTINDHLTSTITINSGTLALAGNPANLFSNIINNGNLVIDTPAIGPAVTPIDVSRISQGLVAGDAIRISAIWERNLFGTKDVVPVTQVATIQGNAQLSDLVTAFSILGSAVNASIDPGDANSVDFSVGNTVQGGYTLTSVSLADAFGTPLEELGVAPVSVSNPSTGQILGIGSQTPFFGPDDELDVFSTDPLNTYGFAPNLNDLGVFKPTDLVGYFAGAGAASVGLSVTLNQLGHLVFASNTGTFTLDEFGGAALGKLGLTAGTYGATVFNGDVSGTGNVIVNQSSGTDLVMAGSVAWTGTTVLQAGQLTLTSDPSQLTGLIQDYGTLAFAQNGAVTFPGTITGTGDPDVTAGTTLTLTGTNTGSGGITLDGGTVLVADAAATGSGTIAFVSGASSALGIGAGITLGNTILGFTGGNTIDLAGFDANSFAVAVGAGNVVSVKDAGGASTTLHFDPASDLNAVVFDPQYDGNGGTALTVVTTGVWVTLGIGAPFFQGNSTSGLGVGGATTRLAVLSQGTDQGAFLSTGARETVANGGEADGTDVGDTATLAVSNGGTLSNPFVDAGGSLDIAAGAVVSGVTLVPGGTIDLTGYLADPISAPTSAALFTVPFDASDGFSLVFSGDSPADYVHLAPDGSGGTLITADEIPCFCRGTLIRTPCGEVPVERLSVGDYVVTLSGLTVPITWIGTGRVLVTRGRRCAATPVIVRKGALADNVPNRDLAITKGHALFVDDVLIPVEFLVNHRSIYWDDRAQVVEFFHVELAHHDVLLANGAPAESYRDDGNRWLFLNNNDGWDQADQPACAPVLTGGAIVDAVWRRLLDRAGPRPGVPLTDDTDLHLVCDGRRIDGRWREDSVLFALPAGAREVRLVSRAASPGELGVARDPRRLGVALRQIRLWRGANLSIVEANDHGLALGCHEFEAEGGLCWTDGDATLPAEWFAGSTRTMEIELLIAARTRYALDAPSRAA